jgi:hypothetical protein
LGSLAIWFLALPSGLITQAEKVVIFLRKASLHIALESL